jgi:hypothetical protein
MSGQPGSKRQKGGVRSAAGKARSGADDCDLVFDLDLTSLRPAVQQVVLGEVLDVDLIAEQAFEAVVCKQRVGGAVVGSLAAFPGLADLIDCIRRGHRYAAKIVGLGRSACRVHVTRASA